MIFSYLQGIIGVIFAFSVAIFVHELGHFMFAKLFGVRVETFSIGFGKKLWGFRRGDTEYKIAAIPFGGYVKMVGTMSKELEDVLEGKTPATEEEKEVAGEAAAELAAPAPVGLAEGIQDEVNALRSKPYWQKLLVFSAGCINNILTAILIYFLMAWIGYYDYAPNKAEIGQVSYISETASPLKVNDLIVSVDGEPVKEYDDFLDYFDEKESVKDFRKSTPLQVVRGGTTISVELPSAPPVRPALPSGTVIAVAGEPVETMKDMQEQAIEQLNKSSTATVEFVVETNEGTTTVKTAAIAGVGPWWPLVALRPNSPARIELLLPNLPAEKSGLQVGDLILSINGEKVSADHEATKVLRGMPGQDAELVVRRGGDSVDATTEAITLQVRADPDNPTIGQIGVMFSGQRTELVKMPFGAALKNAFVKTWTTITRYIDALDRIFGSSFKTIRENLAGPIGISVQFFKQAQTGWFYFIITFAMFNIVLALTNLLPLPVLDGGHILFATIEAIIRRPLPAKVMVAIYNLFTFLIIALALVITFNDLIMNSWRFPFMGK